MRSTCTTCRAPIAAVTMESDEIEPEQSVGPIDRIAVRHLQAECAEGHVFPVSGARWDGEWLVQLPGDLAVAARRQLVADAIRDGCPAKLLPGLDATVDRVLAALDGGQA